MGGNTSKTENDGMDACGMCGGDGSSCADCAQVPNGGKSVDICGVCNFPNDTNRDTSCSELGNHFLLLDILFFVLINLTENSNVLL